jgi:hypothetical protein
LVRGAPGAPSTRSTRKNRERGSGFLLSKRLKTLPTPHPSRSTMRFQRNDKVDEEERES